MTDKEKAKAYDEAIQRARQFMETPYLENSDDVVGYIFPELKESVDERIMKEITELVMQPTWKTEKEFHRRNELCAWLEKQGEIIKEWGDLKVRYIQDDLQEMVELKQKAIGEDKKIRKEIINYFEHYPNIIVKRERKRDWITWLEKKGKENPLKGTLGDVFDDLKFGLDPSPKQGEQKILSALRIEKGKWYMCLHPSKGFVKGRCYKANKDGSIEGDNAYMYVGNDPTDFRLATELEIRGDVGECAV